TSTVRPMTATAYHVGAACSVGASTGSTVPSHPLSNAMTARLIVSTFSQEKLPDSTSHSCVITTTRPAAPATGWGVNKSHGTTSWAKWLAATSTRCSGGGSRWKYQLNGPGIGWVSWW